jgi:hypothetical protein
MVVSLAGVASHLWRLLWANLRPTRLEVLSRSGSLAWPARRGWRGYFAARFSVGDAPATATAPIVSKVLRVTIGPSELTVEPRTRSGPNS